MKNFLLNLIMLAAVSFTIQSCKVQDVKASTPCKTNPPIEDCMCTMQYDPVCGCDGKTYGNDCVARCNGVPSYKPGECE